MVSKGIVEILDLSNSKVGQPQNDMRDLLNKTISILRIVLVCPEVGSLYVQDDDAQVDFLGCNFDTHAWTFKGNHVYDADKTSINHPPNHHKKGDVNHSQMGGL